MSSFFFKTDIQTNIHITRKEMADQTCEFVEVCSPSSSYEGEDGNTSPTGEVPFFMPNYPAPAPPPPSLGVTNEGELPMEPHFKAPSPPGSPTFAEKKDLDEFPIDTEVLMPPPAMAAPAPPSQQQQKEYVIERTSSPSSTSSPSTVAPQPPQPSQYSPSSTTEFSNETGDLSQENRLFSPPPPVAAPSPPLQPEQQQQSKQKYMMGQPPSPLLHPQQQNFPAATSHQQQRSPSPPPPQKTLPPPHVPQIPLKEVTMHNSESDDSFQEKKMAGSSDTSAAATLTGPTADHNKQQQQRQSTSSPPPDKSPRTSFTSSSSSKSDADRITKKSKLNSTPLGMTAQNPPSPPAPLLFRGGIVKGPQSPSPPPPPLSSAKGGAEEEGGGPNRMFGQQIKLKKAVMITSSERIGVNSSHRRALSDASVGDASFEQNLTKKNLPHREALEASAARYDCSEYWDRDVTVTQEKLKENMGTDIEHKDSVRYEDKELVITVTTADMRTIVTEGRPSWKLANWYMWMVFRRKFSEVSLARRVWTFTPTAMDMSKGVQIMDSYDVLAFPQASEDGRWTLIAAFTSGANDESNKTVPVLYFDPTGAFKRKPMIGVIAFLHLYMKKKNITDITLKPQTVHVKQEFITNIVDSSVAVLWTLRCLCVGGKITLTKKGISAARYHIFNEAYENKFIMVKDPELCQETSRSPSPTPLPAMPVAVDGRLGSGSGSGSRSEEAGITTVQLGVRLGGGEAAGRRRNSYDGGNREVPIEFTMTKDDDYSNGKESPIDLLKAAQEAEQEEIQRREREREEQEKKAREEQERKEREERERREREERERKEREERERREREEQERREREEQERREREERERRKREEQERKEREERERREREEQERREREERERREREEQERRERKKSELEKAEEFKRHAERERERQCNLEKERNMRQRLNEEESMKRMETNRRENERRLAAIEEERKASLSSPRRSHRDGPPSGTASSSASSPSRSRTAAPARESSKLEELRRLFQAKGDEVLHKSSRDINNYSARRIKITFRELGTLLPGPQKMEDAVVEWYCQMIQKKYPEKRLWFLAPSFFDTWDRSRRLYNVSEYTDGIDFAGEVAFLFIPVYAMGTWVLFILGLERAQTSRKLSVYFIDPTGAFDKGVADSVGMYLSDLLEEKYHAKYTVEFKNYAQREAFSREDSGVLVLHSIRSLAECKKLEFDKSKINALRSNTILEIYYKTFK